MKFFQKNGLKTEKTDFRIQIYDVLRRKLKACRLFLIQKAVKKLRKSQKKSHETELFLLKKLNSSDLKLFSLFLIKQQKIDITKQTDFFEKISPGFNEKIAAFSKENREIVEKMQKLKKFEEAKEEIGKLLGNVQKKLQKTKLSRKILKEKHRKKRELPKILEFEALQSKKPLINTVNTFINPDKPVKKPFVKYDKKRENPDKNTDNFGGNREEITDKKLRLYQNKPRFNDKNHEFSNKKPEKEPLKFFEIQPIENFVNNTAKNPEKITEDYSIIHPSWQASIERRNQEKFSHFQGIRKKL